MREPKNTETVAIDPAVSDPADKKAIRAALKDGTMIWCLNNQVCRNAMPCATIGCSHKENAVRAGNAAELADCGQYEITSVAERYEAATPLFPYSR